MSNDLVIGARWSQKNAVGMTIDADEVGAICAMADRIEELEGQLQSVLDRETSILRYYDAKLDAADAQIKTAVWALTDIGDGEPEWPDEPARELDWCRDRANRTIAKIKGEQP